MRRDQSFEAQVRRARRAIVFWRVFTVLVALPGTLFHIIGSVFNSLGNICEAFSMPFFTLECDAARRYEALTGVRLGPAIGQNNRYTDLHPLPDDGTLGEWPVTWRPQS